MPKGYRERAFTTRLFQLIKRQAFFPEPSDCLLAVSGGLDSMVMLDFFVRFGAEKWGLKLHVGHLNHGLRPESESDALWLRQECHTRKVPFYCQKLAIPTQSQQSSWEARARESRYAALTQMAQECGARYLLTAHSASDQLETVLMRWIRGGISGLGGIPMKRTLSPDLQILRPLLEVSRQDIEAYAQHRQLSWREDTSNQDPKYFRNRLRQQWLPMLRAENPALEHTITAQSQIWQDEQAWLKQHAQAYIALKIQVKNPQTVISAFYFACADLVALHPALERAVLKQLLIRLSGHWKRFGHQHIEDLRALARAEGGKRLDLPLNCSVSKQKGLLHFALQEHDGMNTEC